MNNTAHRCGYVAIVGRPNVGKSTLLNHMIRQKISITSRKPQTTRHQITGIDTRPGVQVIYVDTPGLHRDGKKAINRAMNRTALSVMRDVDLVLFVVEASRWTDDDQRVLEMLKDSTVPVILVINKIDKLDDKRELLPELQKLEARGDFAELVPLSALRGKNLDALTECIDKRLPEGERVFPGDMPTDRNERFMVAELLREKLMRQLGDELPYAAAVEIERYRENPGLTEIHALILVEREGQKKILIGRQGQRLKQIGTDARKEIEVLLDRKVLLKLWVKVKAGWSDDDRALKSLGYLED